MASIQVRNAPDDLHEALRRRAAAEGRSIGEYVLDVLRRDLELPTNEEWFAWVASQEPVPGINAAEALREARQERDADLDAAFDAARRR